MAIILALLSHVRRRHNNVITAAAQLPPAPARHRLHFGVNAWSERSQNRNSVGGEGGGVMACSVGGNNGSNRSNAFQGREGERERERESMRRTKMGAITISSNKQERRGEVVG